MNEAQKIEKYRKAVRLVGAGLRSGDLADHYDQTRIVATPYCGSPQCVAGWARSLLSRAYPSVCWIDVEDQLCRSNDGFVRLTLSYPLPRYRQPTPAQAADAIDRWLAGSDDPWSAA